VERLINRSVRRVESRTPEKSSSSPPGRRIVPVTDVDGPSTLPTIVTCFPVATTKDPSAATAPLVPATVEEVITSTYTSPSVPTIEYVAPVAELMDGAS